MCGRYVLISSPEELARAFSAISPGALAELVVPSYNVAPSRRVLCLVAREGHRELRAFRWGLIPSWAKDPAIGNRLINARAETVATKPAFRAAFRSRRLAVLADGFYEWRRDVPGPPQPYYIVRADGAPLAFAGLYEQWEDKRPGAPEPGVVATCTIVTTDASEDVASIHDRMPAVLELDALELWLEGAGAGWEELEGVLRPAPAGTLRSEPVGRRVGDVRNDGPELITPLAANR